MTVKELIKKLKEFPEDIEVTNGFYLPITYVNKKDVYNYELNEDTMELTPIKTDTQVVMIDHNYHN